MRDGHTRRIATPESSREGSWRDYQERFKVCLVVLQGGAEGSEFEVEGERVVIGRGGRAELRFEDDAMSQEHAALEFSGRGYRLRDLGSRNGTRLNGGEVRLAELKHGDRLQLGAHVLQLVVEARRRGPRTYVIGDEG
jgi:pSer/pThr/pTyr-binding forkhead associated (FHA) protein